MRRFSWLPTLALCCTSTRAQLDAPLETAHSNAAPAGSSAEAPGRPLLLAPGEVAEVQISAEGLAGERLATPAGTEQFVLILGSTRFAFDPQPVQYSISLEGSSPAGPSRLVQTCALGSEPWRDAPHPSDPAPSGKAPVQGSTRKLHVSTPDGESSILARAVSVGEHAVVWVDTSHPTTLDLAFAEQFRDDFERVIMPRARQVFGTEPDLDGDGRIQLVFSRLTKQRGVAFFSGCDLLGTMQGCLASNHGEYLYLTPPDAIDPPYNTPNAIKEILTHELGHLLHFKRKVLDNRRSEWADTAMLSEGLGGLAQDVVGYQAGNLYVAKAGLDGIDAFSLTDVLDARRRDGVKDGVLRGGSYLFFRYLYDRAGGDAVSGLDVQNRGGPAFVRALIDAAEPVAQALPRVAKASTADLAMDFFTALAADSREHIGSAAATNACFTYLPTVKDPITEKQRGTSLFASFHGISMAGPRVSPASAADGQLLPGGVEYASLDAVANQPEAPFTLRVDPRASARLRVLRWR